MAKVVKFLLSPTLSAKNLKISSDSLQFSIKIYLMETVFMKRKKNKKTITDITAVLKLIATLLDVIASFIRIL